MNKYVSLVETQVRDTEGILTPQTPHNISLCPSPRVLKHLEETEEALKTQYERIRYDGEACYDVDSSYNKKSSDYFF